MRALLIEGAPSAVLLGLSPWILPLIAIAAKRKEEQAQREGKRLARWLGDKRSTRSERCARNRRSWRERIKTKILGK